MKQELWATRADSAARGFLVTLTLLGAASLASCVVSAGPTHEVAVVQPVSTTPAVVVAQAPPPLQVEVIPVAPSPHHVWIGGYWSWHHDHWVWIEGRHVVRPHQAAVWEAGYWAHQPHGWVWIPGHWR